MPNNDYANEPNQSRSEDIIQSILDNTEYDEEARSRIEYLLIELKNAIEGGGGGGGVTSYAPLTEKPKIDNHTLQAGNNSSSDLGLQTKLAFDSAPTENSTNPVTSDGVYTALDSKANSSDVYNKSAIDTALTAKADKSTTYTKSEIDTSLGSKQNTISDLPTIRSGAALGATAVQPVSGKGLSTNDYTTAEKTKLAGIAEDAEVNEIVGIKVNGSTVNPDANKVVNIAGLQTELSASNKLNPAYIDYDSTHRAVSDTEKSTWNGKQNTLTTTQLDAVNSGIDSTKVEQIETNKNNILTANAELIELVDNGAKNKLPNRGTLTKDDITYTWTGGDVVVSGTKSAGANYVSVLSYVELSDLGFNAGDKFIISNNGTNCYLSIIFWSQSQGYTSSIDVITGSDEITVPTDYTHIIARLGVLSAATGTISETIQPMICTKTAWDISHEYQPYAMSNAELTAKEQQNKNNISTVADQTTKYNLLNQSAYTELRNATYNNGVVTQVTSDTRSNLVMQLSLYNGSTFVTQLAQATVKTNGIVSIPFTYNQEGNLIRIGHSGANIDARIVYAIPTDFVFNGEYYFVCTVNNCKQFIDGVTTPYSWQNMAIIPKAIYDSGFTSYQPYAMSNAELTAKELVNENNILSLNTNTALLKNTITTIRFSQGVTRTITFPRPNYNMFIVFGFVQGVGLVNWDCRSSNDGVLSVRDVLTASSVTQDTITYTRDLNAGTATVTISSNINQWSYLTIIKNADIT